MGSKNRKPNKKMPQEKTEIRPTNYLIRFAFIYLFNVAILLSLILQAGLKDGWIFAIFIIALSAKLTNTKFIMDNKRIYTKEEKNRFIWGSWGIVWFISITATILLTLLMSGKERLTEMVSVISAMDTLNFVLNFGLASLVSYLILFFMYHWQPQKEHDALKRAEKL